MFLTWLQWQSNVQTLNVLSRYYSSHCEDCTIFKFTLEISIITVVTSQNFQLIIFRKNITYSTAKTTLFCIYYQTFSTWLRWLLKISDTKYFGQILLFGQNVLYSIYFITDYSKFPTHNTIFWRNATHPIAKDDFFF